MEFLVSIEVRVPPEMDPDRLAELQAAEGTRSRELHERGLLRRIWRVPGRRANVSLYEADTATTLHEALASLPLFPWLDISVQALARHPSDWALSDGANPLP